MVVFASDAISYSYLEKRPLGSWVQKLLWGAKTTAGAVLEEDLAQQLERTARRRERGREVPVRFRLGELRRLGG
jgi:hypothetical protein